MRPEQWTRHRRAPVFLLAFALPLLASCQSYDPSEPFDVVLLVLDSCRADRIGAYGYERPTTPALDRLAADPDTVVFERNYVVGNWTKPATASLFTSRWIHQHGVTNLHVEVDDGHYVAEAVDEGYHTMAEAFRDAGYATIGLVTSHHLAPAYGFDQGFTTYHDPESLPVGDVGRNEKLLELVADLEGPYFAYVHQNACHYPFPVADRDPELMAAYASTYDEAARQAAGIDFTTAAIRDQIRAGEVTLTDEDARFLSLVYDAKLRTTDRLVVEPLIAGLRELDRWDRTMLIVTADHGEELYEHEGYAHGKDLWEEVIRVPLIVKFPRGRRPEVLPDRVDGLTSNVDLYPSLLGAIGQPIPDEHVGADIFESPRRGMVLSEVAKEGPGATGMWWALFVDDDKLLVDPRGPRLYDLSEDPREESPRSEAERESELRSMGEALLRLEPSTGAPETVEELSPETVETLKSLGYL